MAVFYSYSLYVDCKGGQSHIFVWVNITELLCSFLAPTVKYYGPSKESGKSAGTSLFNTPGGSQSKVVPIASLNPYQSKWVTLYISYVKKIL